MQIKQVTLLPALFILAGIAAPAWADSEETLKQQVQSLKTTVDQLKQRLGDPATTEEAEPVTKDDVNGLRSDLENFKYQYNRDREYNTAQSTRPVAISGLVQVRYGADSLGNGNNLTPDSSVNNNRNSSFSNGSAAIQFSGLLRKDYEEGRNLAYTLRIAANPNQPIGSNATANVAVQFANLTYNFLPTLSPEDPRLTGTIGQQIVPFGLDSAAPDELKPTINAAQFVGALAPNIDIGAVVRGEIDVNYDYGYSYRAPSIVYFAGLLNGSGGNTVDNNGKKDLFGRAVFTLPAEYNSWLRQLALGVSYYKGTQNTTILSGADSGKLTGAGKKDRFGFDVYYNHDPVGVTYEFIEGRDVRSYGAVVATPGNEEIKSRGQVLTAYWTIGKQFLFANSALGTIPLSTGRFDDYWPKSYQLFSRFDSFDPAVGKNSAVYGYKQEIATLGLNVFFAQTTKFQLNLNSIDNKNPARKRDNQVLAQFQFGF